MAIYLIGGIWGFALGAFFATAICCLIQADLSGYFKRPKEKLKSKIRKCVMCNCVLCNQDESTHWKGAHIWCETYF